MHLHVNRVKPQNKQKLVLAQMYKILDNIARSNSKIIIKNSQHDIKSMLLSQ